MTWFGSRDRILVAGFVFATLVVFAKPVRYLLDLAADVERTSGLALLPALVILAAVFLFHQQAKRQESRALADSAAADARHAEARALELERLMAFGQALGRSLDLEAIGDVVRQHLPALAASHGMWAVVRVDAQWRSLLSETIDGATQLQQQRIAERALASDIETAHRTVIEGHLCLPITAAGSGVGVLAMPEHTVIETRRRLYAAAAALLGISIRNAQLFREVRENSVRDGLTGCLNRTHSLELIDAELRRARRSHAPLSLIMFDIDHFKDINDRYGHLCGDAVLASVGVLMRDQLRGSDLKCRYGGEEFVALLPETPIEGAKQVAEGLRRALGELHIEWKSERVNVTASFGVTAALPAELDINAFFGRADAALYRAKEDGRDCVRMDAHSLSI
jgi:diguanylate cyclase (GGDEF)-like protein